MTDYSIISRLENKTQCQSLVGKLRAKGKTCYDFCEVPADPANPMRLPKNR